jgi:hypothetical protein
MTNQTLSQRYEQRRIRLLEEEWEVVDRFAKKCDITLSNALGEIIAYWADLHI